MTPVGRRGLLRTLAGGVLLGAATPACGGRPPAASPGPLTIGTPVRGGTASVPPSSTAATGPAQPFQITSGPRDRPRVALTFHGQGSAALADELLREADAAGVRITVLAVGTWLDEQPGSARRLLDGGHELGNHTMHHGNISAMSADRAYAEIADCAERLRRLTGSSGRWFRPSQATDCTPLVAAQARRAGYEHCLGYDLDSIDFTDPGADAVTRTVLGAVRPGSVVSLHFGHPGTVAALPAILDGLHARGLQPVTVSELLA